jgi:hypothetical protein
MKCMDVSYENAFFCGSIPNFDKRRGHFYSQLIKAQLGNIISQRIITLESGSAPDLVNTNQQAGTFISLRANFQES